MTKVKPALKINQELEMASPTNFDKSSAQNRNKFSLKNKKFGSANYYLVKQQSTSKTGV
jgi:hypothetical protein